MLHIVSQLPKKSTVVMKKQNYKFTPAQRYTIATSAIQTSARKAAQSFSQQLAISLNESTVRGFVASYHKKVKEGATVDLDRELVHGKKGKANPNVAAMKCPGC